MILRCIQSFPVFEKLDGEQMVEILKVKKGSVWETESTLHDLDNQGFIEELTLSCPDDGEWLNYVKREVILERFEVIQI